MDAAFRKELEDSLYVHFPLKPDDSRSRDVKDLEKAVVNTTSLWDGTSLTPWKFEGEGIRYWIGNINERMDTKILKDILLAGSYNRIISVNEEYGCCLSGYMLDGEEYQQLL